METYQVYWAKNAIQIDENTYRPVSKTWENNQIIQSYDTNSPEDGVLKVGEEIHGWKIVGFYDDSIVMRVPDGYIFPDPGEDFPPIKYTHLIYSVGMPPDGDFIVNANDLPVCFCKGTLIETNTGPVAVEQLQEGDYVLGSKGWQRVKWIGWRKYNLQLPWITADRKTKCVPVRITQGALGGGLPTKDLSISPWHHIYIDGQLVRANDIVNGITILREMNAKHIEYYHLELDEFDIIQAHGVFSESWADGGNRSFFENVKVTDLKPEDSKRRQADRPGFVLMRDKKAIRELNLRLEMQARLLENKKTA